MPLIQPDPIPAQIASQAQHIVDTLQQTDYQLQDNIDVETGIYDSANKPHFDDTRGTGQGQFPNGVGSGVINFRVDGAGRPTAYQFSPPTSAAFDYVQISLGRAEPL